jgi:hypothetical protein
MPGSAKCGILTRRRTDAIGVGWKRSGEEIARGDFRYTTTRWKHPTCTSSGA